MLLPPKVLKSIRLDKSVLPGYCLPESNEIHCLKLGFNIVEVPSFLPDPTIGESKMSKGIFKEAYIGSDQPAMEKPFHKY